jgi:hypothetical protein
MKQLYYAHIYPHLIGNISIWGTTNPQATYIQPLIKMQKKIIRLINRCPPRTHSNPLMIRHQILNITNLYILRVCTEMHPFIHPESPLNRPEHDHNYTLTSQIHNHQTRYSTQNHQFIPQLKHYSKTRKPTLTTEHLTANYTKVWNSLPTELRNIKSKDSFKKLTKQYLLTQQASPPQHQ